MFGATCGTCGFRYAEYQGHIIPCPRCAAAELERRVEKVEYAAATQHEVELSNQIGDLESRLARLEEEKGGDVMPIHPWPQRVHPFLVELIDQVCGQFAIPNVRLARPYFGYRSNQEQAALYAQGRAPLYEVNMQRILVGLTPITETENQRTVTNAKPGQSKHNLDPAEAGDLVVVSLAKGVQYVWDAGVDLQGDGIAEYVELGRIGERLGLIWGGAWKTKDYGHLELPPEEFGED